jgi:hypothetical protein
MPALGAVETKVIVWDCFVTCAWVVALVDVHVDQRAVTA